MDGQVAQATDPFGETLCEVGQVRDCDAYRLPEVFSWSAGADLEYRVMHALMGLTWGFGPRAGAPEWLRAGPATGEASGGVSGEGIAAGAAALLAPPGLSCGQAVREAAFSVATTVGPFYALRVASRAPALARSFYYGARVAARAAVEAGQGLTTARFRREVGNVLWAQHRQPWEFAARAMTNANRGSVALGVTAAAIGGDGEDVVRELLGLTVVGTGLDLIAAALACAR